MIAYLKGKLLEKHPNGAIVDVGGVGYEVTIPVSTFSALPETGSVVELRIHTHVREDALSLYGFHSAEEKTLFEKLISVSGIGPRLAVTVLSGLQTGELVTVIQNGDVHQLVRIPGVGKKTAERIVLELRDKLDVLRAAASSRAGEVRREPLSPVDEDVLSALVNLGCNRAASEAALRKAKATGAGAEFEPLFRRALEMVR